MWSKISNKDNEEDRLSTSTTNTTSSNQEQDDLDGSDSLPEYHANYVKQGSNNTGGGGSSRPHSSGGSLQQHQTQQQQPDLLHSNIIYGASVNTYTGKIYGGSMMEDYANYNSQSRLGYSSSSQNNLLEAAGNNKMYVSPNYSSPYLQSASPISQLSNSTPTAATSHHHHHHGGHLSTSSPLVVHRHHSQQQQAGWGDLVGYSTAYASGRFNAVAHSLQQAAAATTATTEVVDLNESSVGTHV